MDTIPMHESLVDLSTSVISPHQSTTASLLEIQKLSLSKSPLAIYAISGGHWLALLLGRSRQPSVIIGLSVPAQRVCLTSRRSPFPV